ncbi:hypothetical protein BV25DRAFT_1915946 [Artomyces pyxidatus]|uniref:Uncharacterized protein n=1 Tax=Artomyces pyxidatus TaxID=48021 RepID=A0ACB8T2F0_9AGAM|nr:hypothetical protein BV25DRAFT_1915946 [Artomyces pyxidatus]
MSFIQSILGDFLVRDSWPQMVARLAQDDKEFNDMSSQETVPATFESLCEWVYVYELIRSRDLGRRYRFLHQPGNTLSLSGSDGRGREVTIRFQGFLGQHNLKPLGNWRGELRNAHKAVQFVELGCGPFIDQMESQISCVANIKKLVFRDVLNPQDASAALPESTNVDRTLSFQRRVFTKIVSGNDSTPSVLSIMDDPTRQAASVSKFWRVTTKIAFGRKTIEGRVERCNHRAFSPGDFIDVTARIDIANVRTKYDVNTLKVFLAPITIVQLCKAEDVNQAMGVERTPQVSDEEIATVGGLESGGIVFDYIHG